MIITTDGTTQLTTPLWQPAIVDVKGVFDGAIVTVRNEGGGAIWVDKVTEGYAAKGLAIAENIDIIVEGAGGSTSIEVTVIARPQNATF